MAHQTKIARGLAWNYSAYATEAVVGLLLLAFVVRQVGVADYGVLTLALSISGLLAVMDFGLLGLLVQACIAERTRGGRDAASALLSAAFGVLLLLGLAAAAISGAVALSLPGAFRIDAALVSTASVCLALTGATLIASMPGMAIEMGYQSAGAFGAISRIQMISIVIRASATIIVLRAGMGVTGLAVVHLGTAVLRLILLWVGLSRNTDGLRLTLKGASWDRVRALRRNRGWATSDNVARQIASSADSILIGIFSSAAMVGAFGVAKRIPSHLQAIASKGIEVTLPFLAERHHREEEIELRQLFERTLLVSGLFLVPISVFAIAMAPWIVKSVAGDAYASAVPILRWLLVATSVQAFSGPAFTLLYARGKIAEAARIGIAESIVNVAMTVLLVPQYGGVGAAAATALTHFVATFGWFLPASMRAAGLSGSQLVAGAGRMFREIRVSR